MVNLDDMLFEVSSETRHNILVMLLDRTGTVTGISNKLDISMTEASRHINRLAQVGLIQKQPDGDYKITILGKTVLSQLGPLEFITRHSKYFDSHDATGIPTMFLNRIHELDEATPTYTSRANIMKTVEKFGNSIKEAKEHYECIFDQSAMELIIYSDPDPESENNTRTKMGTGLRCRVLLPDTVDYDRIHPDSMKEFIDLHRYENFEFRLLEEAPVFLQMNEKEVALLAFPDMNNAIDYLGFEATDIKSLTWCMNLFDYYWEQSKPFLSKQ
ncbi:MAG: ArsR family transcriptional regulator [Candidatus Bathyarchaeota archaeon]|nr:ArsR family transcriptional regulator [Candidatus Bathyarchaeota archaeon]